MSSCLTVYQYLPACHSVSYLYPRLLTFPIHLPLHLCASIPSTQVRVEEARTKNLYLRNTLRKLEAQVGAKETVADSGLALIDFEQLKIENQVWF